MWKVAPELQRDRQQMEHYRTACSGQHACQHVHEYAIGVGFAWDPRAPMVLAAPRDTALVTSKHNIVVLVVEMTERRAKRL